MIFKWFKLIFNNFWWFFKGAILKKMAISFKENALRVTVFFLKSYKKKAYIFKKFPAARA